MATTAQGTFAEEMVQAAGIQLQLRKGGSGEPLLILASELGVPDWLSFHQLLAGHYTVYAPSLPGFGRSERPDWIVNVRDLAAWVAWFVRDMNLTQPLKVIGFSMGGWAAAELATFNSSMFSKMVLVSPAGIKPETGETWDYFTRSGEDAFRAAFHDPEHSQPFAQYYGRKWTDEEEEQVEINREMAARLLWKPYMKSHTLAGLLPGIKTETLIVWGRENAIIPLSAANAYKNGIKGAKLKVLDGCGHMPEMEKPEEFTKLVLDFLR